VNFPFLFQYFSFSCICALRSQLLEHVSIIEVVKLPKTKYLINILNKMIIRRKHWYPVDACHRCKGVGSE
jgi:hypothetical protein